MATERKKRTSRNPERLKLIQYCEISIRVLEEVDAQAPSDNMKGQITALRAVLRQLGQEEK